MTNGHLFRNLPADCPEELIETLISGDGVRIERIVSDGQASAPDFWYDQEEHEFVVVLQGHAVIRFEDGSSVALEPGTWLYIAPHRRHRVESTSPTTRTIWLALFWKPGSG